MLFIADYTGVGEDRPYPNAKFLTVIPMKDWVNNYSWIWTPNSRWVNQARFGFNRMTENIVNADSGVLASSYGINTGITSPGGLPSIGIGGFAPLGTTFTRPGFNGPSPLYDGLDTVSYVRGRHAIKFGFEVAHIEADAGGFAFGRGSVTFAGSGAFPGSTALEDFLAGSPSFGLLLVGNPRRQLAQWSYAGFAQDDWRITPKLTLNAGLRYEYFAPPTEAHNLLGNFDPNVGLVQVGKQISSPSGSHQLFAAFRHRVGSHREGAHGDPSGGESHLRPSIFGGILWAVGYPRRRCEWHRYDPYRRTGRAAGWGHDRDGRQLFSGSEPYLERPGFPQRHHHQLQRSIDMRNPGRGPKFQDPVHR
jgi:outer membrane receptor protein involved in Fe transport